MNWLRREAMRQARGTCAIAAVLGWPLTCALLVLLCALLALALVFRGPWIFVGGCLCALLAIRAHDLGELPEAANDDAPPPPADVIDLERERVARAQAAFLSDRDTAALGPPHDPQEL